MHTVPILFEDDNIVVINKPSGMVVHGDGKSTEETLCDILLNMYPGIRDVGEPMTFENGKTIYRPGIVHRLDRGTSGCLIVAKNQESFLFLKNQFQNHLIQKKYLLWVYGSIKSDSGDIDAPIGRSTGDVRKWATGRGIRGAIRNALTQYHVCARYGRYTDRGSTEDGSYTLVEAFPRTGRTHQIRVHMKHLNHPIIGDTLYASQKKSVLGFTRLALHAAAITFQTIDGVNHTISAPIPDDFMEAEKQAKMLSV